MSSPYLIAIFRLFQSFSLRRNFWKPITVVSLMTLLSFCILWPDNQSSNFEWPTASANVSTNEPTSLSHIGFIVVGSLKTWKYRHAYVQTWWQPNITKGYVFLDKPPSQEFLPWPSIYPPYKINEDITELSVYPKIANPLQVRMFRSILDMYKVGEHRGLRWLIMCDDDTVVFVENLVEVLNEYDHSKYYYIGDNSEFVKANAGLSFDMGFGGAGYGLSYGLFEELARELDGCIERYAYLWVSDHMAQSCLADLGVALTLHKGIHQIDLRGDISGLLSAHPQCPAITLHHFDIYDPIFPSMNRTQALNHLMKVSKYDQSRIFQQTICYQREKSWSFSVSWGYSVHIYENLYPRSVLRKPLETFRPWTNGSWPVYMLNTRPVTDHPCRAPHVFFFQSLTTARSGNQFLTRYARASPRSTPPCGNHSADPITVVQVLSPATTKKTAGVIECCDVGSMDDARAVSISIRSCLKGEVIA